MLLTKLLVFLHLLVGIDVEGPKTTASSEVVCSDVSCLGPYNSTAIIPSAAGEVVFILDRLPVGLNGFPGSLYDAVAFPIHFYGTRLGWDTADSYAYYRFLRVSLYPFHSFT